MAAVSSGGADVPRGSSPRPEARPGEEGFDGFNMELPENCIEYMVFVVDPQTESQSLLLFLEGVRKAAMHLCEELTHAYIWQRQAFGLEVKVEKGRCLVYLHGITDYGDNVEDEWLIVYLLRELSKKFPSLWVRVSDSDGEFLLIEAANVLPKWLNPEMDSNRVWVHDSRLHIIPSTAGTGPMSGSISLEQAVNFLRSSPEALVHSDLIEAEAFYRLGKYPAQVTDSMHHSLAAIPRKLAYILHKRPKAIAPATEAFYLRDPLSLKPLLSPSKSLIFPPEDLVTVSIRFTKILFAQIVSQRFDPPPAWKTLLRKATAEASGGAEEARIELRQLELGMKVTAGFEMLIAKAEQSGSRTVREVAVLVEDLEEDGNQALPTDNVLRAWPDVNREDDDSWMNINYQDFERELEGRRNEGGATDAGFGDSNTHADLRKMVSRFEAFLNDEVAGIDGAEVDELDIDDDNDDSDEESNSEDEDEDKEVSFDEEQFASMMREMMGFPPEVLVQDMDRDKGKGNPGVPASQIVPDEDEEIRQLAAQMESELRSHGALHLDPTPGGARALKDARLKTQHTNTSNDASSEGESDAGEEIDIDYNLAKNILESFKSQAGVAGPAGNLLGLMGMSLPRDEDDGEEEKN
ncbi:SGT1-domain-containing protein [Thozetella sp. PMI_491]|nr:SGT1-domain-containing protein [Thozetella sp. PMI_491]